jgi:AcrR family transcriptional regulator
MTSGKAPAAASPSRAERGEQMRLRLLEATIAAMAQDGVAGASIERITHRAGVSRGLVRHYYGSKNRLLAEAFQLLADNFRRMLGMFDDATEAEPDPVLRLRQAILPMFERLRGPRDYQYAWLGFWALARSDDEIARLNNALYEEIGSYLGRLIDAAAGERHNVDTAAAGRGLIAMMEGAWLHCLIGVDGVTVSMAEGLCLDYASRLLGSASLGDPPDGR